MVSRRTRALAVFLRATRRRSMVTAERARTAMSAPPGGHTPPRGLHRRCRITARKVGGFPCYTVAPRSVPETGTVVIYLHGGSFFREISWWHWRVIGRMVAAGHRVEVPIYPLAPQYTHRDVPPYLAEVYRRVLAEFDSAQVVLAGDSAGGTLALLFAQRLPEVGLPVPARLILLSPCLDMRLTNPEIDAVAALDPWLARPGLLEAGRVWADGDDLGSPALSPINGSSTGLPPTDVYMGTHDLLYPDARLFAERVGSTVRFVEEPGAFHVYPLVPIPEAGPVVREILTTLAAVGAERGTARDEAAWRAVSPEPERPRRNS